YPTMLARQPNAGHVALTRIHTLHKLLAVITQNIDGLHQKAHTSPDRVIELHGSTHELKCLVCGTVFDGPSIQRKLEEGDPDPRCERCGGPLRTGTILFGEALPKE